MKPTEEDLARSSWEDMNRCVTFHTQVECNIKLFKEQGRYSGTGFPEFMLESPLIAEAWIRRAAQAEMELEGAKKAIELLNKGMESQCELMDSLKQRLRLAEQSVKLMEAKSGNE